MKKTLIILIVLATINITGWQIARSQQTDSVANPDVSLASTIETTRMLDESISVDTSQIILAEYQWNGKKYQVSLSDFKAAIQQLPIYYQENYTDRAGKEKYLSEFINEKLKVLAAIDKGFDKDEALLKKVQDYKHTRLVQRLTLIEVDEKVSLTEEDFRRYYEKHKAEYIEEAAARATSISVVEKVLAQEVLAQIKAGVDITELAKGLSEKGKLLGPGSNKANPGSTGLFTKDESQDWQAFVDAVFDMEVGEITEEILEVDVNRETYYLVFRKEEHIPERMVDFEEVRDHVESSVKHAKKRQRIIEWITEVTAASGLKIYPERAS